MCAVFFPFIHRLFSSFVLMCFLWTTLFHSFAFAEFTRADADPAHIERHDDCHYAHFSVGARKMEEHPSSKDDAALNTHMLPAKTPTLIVPIGNNLKNPELLFEKAFYESGDITPTSVDDGLSWTDDGLDFYRENISGDLVVSKHDSSLHSPSTPIELSNHHGSTILGSDLPYEYLTLCGKDVIQRGKQDIKSLLLRNQGTFVNTNFLSVGKLVFDSCVQDASAQTSPESSRASSPTPSLGSDESTASSHSIGFLNEDTLRVREETTFGLLKPISNTGKMTYEQDVIFLDDVLLNKTEKSIFECHQKLQGTLKELFNEGNLNVGKGFNSLHIRQFTNKGNIHGNGHLIVGERDHTSINTGMFRVDQLTLGLAGDISNNGTMHVDEILRTHGESTFHQRGTLSGKKVVINNTAFENEHNIDSSTLDLSFGDHVATFRNHKTIVLKTKSLTFSASTELKTSTINEGDLVTERFSNARDTFINRDHITATSWDQHGKAFTNEFGGTIDVVRKSQFDTDRIENAGDMTLAATTGRIDQLINTGGFTSQHGGFKAKTIRNTKKMDLLDGEYTLDHLENKGGEATIDQLSLMSESPTLEGKLTVNYFKPTFAEYKHIQSDGDITLASGDFKTKELSIKGALTLGKGHYHIDVLKGDKNAKLLLQRGARVTIGDAEYDGDIVSSVSVEVHVFPKEAATNQPQTTFSKQLQNDHKTRATAFNAIPTATPVKKPILEETVFTKSKSIIDAMSDYSRFNPNKGCDLTELKSRFKVRMGTEVTRIIYDQNKRDILDIQKTLPVLPTTDKLFGHFEITRYSSKISRDIIEKITTDGMDILDSLSFYVPSFDSDLSTLRRYRYDLTRDMFMLWFKEVLIEHDEGFTPYKFLKPSVLPPPPPPAAEDKKHYLTYRAPNSKPGGIEELLHNHSARQSAFNAIPTETPPEASVKKESVYSASRNILGVLGSVSERIATDTERKNILQTVMGSQITDIIHDEAQKKAIDLEGKLPTVGKTHFAYRHFEILRLTAKLSRMLVQQIYGDGYDALDDCTANIPDFELDTDTLCRYSGIKRDMFMLWFKEIFEQHQDGFPDTTASITFLSPMSLKSRNQSFNLTRIHTLGSEKNLILHIPGREAADFMEQHRAILKFNGSLTVRGESFIPTRDFEFNAHVKMHINTYQNDGHDAAFSALDLYTEEFQNGTSNQKMGTLRTVRPKTKLKGKKGCDDPKHGHHLNVMVKGHVHNEYGTLFGAGTTTVLSIYGDILWGESKLVPAGSGRFYHRGYNTDPNGFNGERRHYIHGYESNNAGISSDSSLRLVARKGNIKGNYGFLFSSASLYLIAETLDQEIDLLSTQFDVGGSLYINGTKFNFGRLKASPPHNLGSSGAYANITNETYQSDTTDLNCLGNVHFNVNHVSITGNDLRVLGSIFKLDKDITKDYSSSISISPLYCYGGSNGGWGIEKGAGGNVFAGDKYEVRAQQVNHSGYQSGKTVTITSEDFHKQGIGSVAVRMDELGFFVSIEPYVQENGFTQQRQDGTFGSKFPLSIQNQLVSDEEAPVLNHSTLGFAPGTQRYVDASIERFPLLRMISNNIWRLYNRSSDEPIDRSYLRTGQEYALNGQLNRDGIIKGNKALLYFEEKDGKNFITFYFPAKERSKYAGRSGVTDGEVVDITAMNDMNLDSAIIHSDKKTQLTIGRDFNAKTSFKTEHVNDGHIQTLGQQCHVGSDGALIYTVGRDENFACVEREAGDSGILAEIQGNRRHLTVAPTSHQVFHSGNTTTIVDTKTPFGCTSKTSGKIIDKIGGSSVCINEYLEGRKGIVQEAEGDNLYFTENGYSQTETHTVESKNDSFLGLGTEKAEAKHVSGFSKAPGTVMIADDDQIIELISHKGNQTVQQPTFKAKKVIFRNPGGIASILQGIEESWSSMMSSDKSMWWHSMDMQKSFSRTYNEGSVSCPIGIHADKVFVEQVEGKISRILDKIDIQEGTLEISYVKELFEHDEFHHDGPAAELVMVVGLAAAVCGAYFAPQLGVSLAGSMGMATAVTEAGATVMATTAGAYTATMMSAALTSLASQFAVATLIHKGDPVKALQSLGTKEAIKRVALAMATAGVMKGIGQLSDKMIPTSAAEVTESIEKATEAAKLLDPTIVAPTLAQQLPAHAAFQATQLAVNTSLSAAFGERIDRAFKASAILAAVNTAGGVVSNNIGRAFDANEMNSITHDLVHGINGAIGGAIIDGKDGAVAGAFGAMLSERLAKTLMPTKVEVTETITNAAGEKVQVTKIIRPTYTTERISQVHAIIHFAVGTGAFLTGMDAAQMAVAVNASVIAVEHNHGDTLRRRDGGLDTIIEEDEVDAEDVDNDPTYDSDNDVNDIPAYDFGDDVEDIGFVNKKGQLVPKDDKQNHAHTPKQSTQVDDPELSFLSHLQADTGDFGISIDGRHSPTGRTAAAEKAADDCRRELLNADERTRFNYKMQDNNPENRAQSAYRAQQTIVGQNAIWKGLTGQPVTDAEKQVRNDYLMQQASELALDVALVKAGDAYRGIKKLFTKNTINTVSSVGILEKGTGLRTQPAVNLNNPVRPTANLNRMSVAHSLTEASDAHGMQRLAQNVSAGAKHTAPRDIDYRHVYMSSKASAGGSHVGSGKGATQTALDSIAGKSSGGSLTLDGNGRILSGSKDSGSLRIYPRPVDEKVSVEDLFQRPVGLMETTERTLASYERVKAARATSIQQHIDQVTGVDRASARTQFFGTDRVADFSNQRVGQINGRMPINSEYAGKVYFDKLPHDLKIKYPHGIPFTGTGHPDFSRYAEKSVKIKITGDHHHDFKAADKAAGIKSRPNTHTWHHHEDGQTMMLIPKDLHKAVKHTGGVAKGGY